MMIQVFHQIQQTESQMHVKYPNEAISMQQL